MLIIYFYLIILKYYIRDLSNNSGLIGKISNIQDKQFFICNFSGTKICYLEDEKNPSCIYPEENYVCTKCDANANINDESGICECNEGYTGIGYIECTLIDDGKIFFLLKYKAI